MTSDELKVMVGRAATAHIVAGKLVGVGTGSTVDCFIDALAPMKDRIAGAVSSSVRTTERLRHHGIPVVEPDDVELLPVYVDGADEIDHEGFMIKGGGAALTREKILADMALRFVCIADQSKLVQTLGKFPLPIEVIPMAAVHVARRVRSELDAEAVPRLGVVTDNGCQILDVRGLTITDPLALERDINQWPGVVTVGIFARNKATICVLGTANGVKTLTF